MTARAKPLAASLLACVLLLCTSGCSRDPTTNTAGSNAATLHPAQQEARLSPRVLVLSEFAGAAHELRDAVLTNPWHVDGMARDLDHALRMDLEERRTRHSRLVAVVEQSTALSWAEDFLCALSPERGPNTQDS